MRTFISIHPDEEANKKILEIQKEVKNNVSFIDKRFLDQINWTEEEKFHLTLFFIGDTDSVKLNKIDECLTAQEKILPLEEVSLTFKGINAFPKLRYPRVLIIELDENKKILQLSEKINKCLELIGLKNDNVFHPHITIGRIKRDRKMNLTGVEKNITSDLNFTVKEFHLMESRLKSSGAEYSVLKTYKI